MWSLDGAAYYKVFYGESINDLEITLNKIRNSKEYEEFAKTRGENEIIKSFSVEDILSFN